MSDLHFVIFKGLVEELDFKTCRFIDFLRRKDIDFWQVDVNDIRTYNGHDFERFISEEGCVVFTYNNIGINLSVDGVNTWKKYNIPFFSFLVDHPRNFDDALLHPPCDINVFCCDRDHVEFVRRFYPEVKEVFFVPQGGMEVNSLVPTGDRPIDVIYMGSNTSFYGYPRIPFIEDGGADFYSFCVSYLCSFTMETADKAIDLFLANNPALQEYELELHLNYGEYIQSAVRRKFKLDCMHAIDDAGIHVDIYGNEWEDADRPFSDNIAIHKRIPLNDLLNIVRTAKISLCFVPWFKRGSSEKNFDSMLNGALCITDESEYLKEHYRDGYNIVYFDLRNPNQLAADIKWLLEHPDELEKIASRGYCTAKEYDNWDIRYRQIYSIITGRNHK